MKDSKKIKQIETKAPLKIDISKVTRQRQNKNEDLLSSVPKSEFLNEGKKWSFKDELPNKIDLKKIQSQFSAANPKSLDHSEIFKEDEKDDQQSLLNFKQEVSKLKSLHTSKTIGYSQVNKKKQSIQSANLHQQAKELKIQAQSPNTSSLQQISKTLQVNDSVQLLKSPKIIPLDFKTQQKIEMKKSIVGVDEMKSYQQFSKIEIIESKVDSNLDSDEEDEGEEEQESLYYSLNSSEEEQRREIERNKRKQKKLLKEKQKINANSQQKLSRKKIIQQESINLESYYSDEADLKKKAHIHNKEKFFIESLNQMENKNSLNHLEKQNDSFEDQLQEDNKFGDYSSLEYNESMYNEIQDGQKGKGVFGTKRKRLISDFKDLREGINKDDVEANDSFESYIEQQELNWTGDMTSKPRYKDREDRLRITPFASPKLNHFSSQITKYKDQGDTQSVQPPSQNEISLSKNKSLKKIYVRSIHKLVPEKAWEEKSFKLDVVEMSLEEGQSIKARLANKEILSDYGISVHSKKGNSQDNNHNMSDYFLYIDKNIKLISVIMGHGAYGNFISNLTCRLLFKHFFRESLIKLQPQIGFKRLFMNVDKFISQHIIYYELEDTYNCMLSGASCTLVLIEQNKVFVASLGNTQAVIFRQQFSFKTSKSNYMQLSGFHLPTNRYEKERIHKNTGEIRQWKNDFIDRVFVRGRTFPGIEVTRCFGNDVAKMIGVINEPDIYYYEVSKLSDQFLLVTTPNFFDYISYEEKTVKKANEVLLKRIKSLQAQDTEIISDLTFALYYFF